MWFCSLIQYLLMLIQSSEPGTDWTEEFEHLNWKERIWAMWLHRLLQNRLRLWNLTPKILSRGSNNYYSHFHLTIREIKLCIIPSQEYDASIRRREWMFKWWTYKENQWLIVHRTTGLLVYEKMYAHLEGP